MYICMYLCIHTHMFLYTEIQTLIGDCLLEHIKEVYYTEWHTVYSVIQHRPVKPIVAVFQGLGIP